MIDWDHIALPICEVIPQVKAQLSQNNTLIIKAPPGAGKSTLLPLALMDEPWLSNKKILMLEPRRLAARAIACRMSNLMNESVGESVGYRVRFDNRVSTHTRVEVLTEGILTRMLQTDNSLEGVGMVIFDEFHERSLFADLALAICREVQQILRPDLRIVIMSATLDLTQLASLLDAPVVESAGRQYPVSLMYGDGCDPMFLPESVAEVVCRAVKSHAGDLLAFLPGEGEIRKCEELLKRLLPDFVIAPLFGQLPQHQQLSAIMPDKQGRRKVVLSTSIAETSLTIEGIRIVVDSGFGRASKFNSNTALSRLETVPISQDIADQRAGRAGRLAPGFCYRLWSKATHDRLEAHRTPEILETDLSGLVLDLAMWGVDDMHTLTWLTPPPVAAVMHATTLLQELEALENGKITEYGKQMHRLPCHPRIAHMLIRAREIDQHALGSDIAALLEERDPLSKEAGIDINLRVEALRRYRQRGGHGKQFARIEKVAQSYRRLLNIEPDNGSVNPYETGFLLVNAYPERIASAYPGNNAMFQLSGGLLVRANHRDDLAAESWLAVAHLDARDGKGQIFLASALDPQDLVTLVKERDLIQWDLRKGGLVANREMRIGTIVLKSRPLTQIDPQRRVKAICEVLRKEGAHLLDFNEEVSQWQNRVLSLRIWRAKEEEGWPDVSVSALLEKCEEWLAPYLEKISKTEELKRLNLGELLPYCLPYELQQRLEELAPRSIEVPSGSKIRLEYSADGSQPILAVRLQELFGLPQTPTLNQGSVRVVLHLLSPGFKPVQVTSDLSSFWNNTYFEVKKELRRRYPKHVWPDDPWTETAIRGIKRKG